MSDEIKVIEEQDNVTIDPEDAAEDLHKLFAVLQGIMDATHTWQSTTSLTDADRLDIAMSHQRIAYYFSIAVDYYNKVNEYFEKICEE